MSGTPEWQSWLGMKTRILNPNAQSYGLYGGRGLGMYGGWVNDFPAFFAHIGPKPGPEYSIDRIDNDLGYFPGNVRWATRSQQELNKRRP